MHISTDPFTSLQSDFSHPASNDLREKVQGSNYAIFNLPVTDTTDHKQVIFIIGSVVLGNTLLISTIP